MKINSNTISIDRDNEHYSELEKIVKKVASDNSIEDVEFVKISLFPDSGQIKFKVAQDDTDEETEFYLYQEKVDEENLGQAQPAAKQQVKQSAEQPMAGGDEYDWKSVIEEYLPSEPGKTLEEEEAVPEGKALEEEVPGEEAPMEEAPVEEEVGTTMPTEPQPMTMEQEPTQPLPEEAPPIVEEPEEEEPIA